MAEAAGALWVSSVDSDAVQRIDPATNEPGQAITTEALPDGLLEHDGSLWVATDLGPILQRVDPATGEITGTWEVSDQGAINANQLVVEAGGAFWFPLLDGGEVLKVRSRPESSTALGSSGTGSVPSLFLSIPYPGARCPPASS